MRRLQRRVSKKYLVNRKGEHYCKTSNIIKAEKAVLKVHKRLNGIRHNYLQQTTSEIVNRKPMFIAIEDLNISGMMKNKHLSKAIQEQCLYEFRRQIQYKSSWNKIPSIKLLFISSATNKLSFSFTTGLNGVALLYHPAFSVGSATIISSGLLLLVLGWHFYFC